MAKEIELPTKSKQDDIYSNTKDIKSDMPEGIVKSVQRGLQSDTIKYNEEKKVSISKVDENKSFVNILTTFSKEKEDVLIHAELEDSTTLKFTNSFNNDSYANALSISWEVIEFY